MNPFAHSKQNCLWMKGEQFLYENTSINKVFNDSLDGLIIVDMRETPQKYLDRYLGKEGARNCQAIWQLAQDKQKIA